MKEFLFQHKFILVLAIFLVFLILISLIFRGATKKEEIVEPTITSVPTKGFFPTKSRDNKEQDLPPTQTGYAPDEFTEKEKSEIKKRNELIRRTPVSEKEFTITFVPKTLEFNVVLTEPKNQSRTVFDAFLKQNGFDVIPVTEFVFK